MKAIKLTILGALLILLGPIMSAIDVYWNGFHLICWIIGIPVFLVGFVMPAGGFMASKQDEKLPQRQVLPAEETMISTIPSALIADTIIRQSKANK